MDYNSQKAARLWVTVDWLRNSEPSPIGCAGSAPPAPAGMTQGCASRAGVLLKPATRGRLALAGRLHGGAARARDAAAGPEGQCPELQLRGSGDAAPTWTALPVRRGGELARTHTFPGRGGGGGWQPAPYVRRAPQG